MPKTPCSSSRPSLRSSEFTEKPVAQGLTCRPVIRCGDWPVGRLSGRYRLLALFGLGIVVLAISSLALGHVIGHRCGGWSGCDAGGLPLGSVTVRDLETHPEAALYYPGAALIVHGGTDEQHHLLASPGSAYSSSIL